MSLSPHVAVTGLVPSAPPSFAIELDAVARRYVTGAGVVTALEGVDLHIAAGELVVILGPSGSGKTTLLNLIGALDIPTEGKIRIAGQELQSRSTRSLFRLRRVTVSFIFQSFNLFPGLTALENVEFGAAVARREHAREIAKDAVDRVGLSARFDHFPHQLSGGEQQRVAIARALATGNPILLADEPTGELDFATGRQILELLREEAVSGKTIAIVTHNREVARIADRVVELSGGHIVRDAPPEGGPVSIAELRW